MKTKEAITNEIKEYIIEASLSDPKNIKHDTMIFDEGLLDSMGLLFLVEFLNENYEFEIGDEELNPSNFECIDKISDFVLKKLSS